MKTIKTIILLAIFSTVSFAQLTKDDVREILLIQGGEESAYMDEQVNDLYDRYSKNNSYQTSDLAIAFGYSTLSGFSQGSYESYTYSYDNTSWMPQFMENWYNKRVSGDELLGPSLTYHKVLRSVDYISDRMAYKQYKRYFDGNPYLATAAQYFVKSFATYMTRNKYRTGSFL
ncbi:MAG: hypothetical protein JEY94_04100 [Melioribacteraceae bacterium]|nr:hypothetical protein [Melioribacteraceae bacterium]